MTQGNSATSSSEFREVERKANELLIHMRDYPSLFVDTGWARLKSIPKLPEHIYGPLGRICWLTEESDERRLFLSERSAMDLSHANSTCAIWEVVGVVDVDVGGRPGIEHWPKLQRTFSRGEVISLLDRELRRVRTIISEQD